MPDIHHSLIIETPSQDIFDGVSTPNGIDNWWAVSSEGQPVQGSVYNLGFGELHPWRAIVTKSSPPHLLEMKFVQADPDWMSTIVGFEIRERTGISSELNFYHKGWKENNAHFKSSSYCWAMYLRILKRFLEKGEVIPYSDRLNQ